MIRIKQLRNLSKYGEYLMRKDTMFIAKKCAMSTNIEYINHCREIARLKDYNEYLVASLLPTDVQHANFALRAFNVEIAGIPETTQNNQQTAQFRYQFWKDAIHKIYMGNTPNHPIALGIADAVRKHSLTRRWFDRLIESRESDFISQQSGILPSNIEAIEEYCENTASSLKYLSLETLGVRDVATDHVASHIGKASGLLTLVKSIPYHLSKGNIYFPVDLIEKSQLDVQRIVDGEMDENKVSEIVFEISSQAHAHLSHARELSKNIKTVDVKRVFMSSYWMENQLNLLEKIQFNVFDERIHRKSGSDVIKLLLKLRWKSWRNEY